MNSNLIDTHIALGVAAAFAISYVAYTLKQGKKTNLGALVLIILSSQGIVGGINLCYKPFVEEIANLLPDLGTYMFIGGCSTIYVCFSVIKKWFNGVKDTEE